VRVNTLSQCPEIDRPLQQSSDRLLGHEILRNLGVIPSAEELSAIQRWMQQTGAVYQRGVGSVAAKH
jgi:hypothetical protein